MIRSFNYTGRVRIPKSTVNIELGTNANGERTFTAKLDLGQLSLPPESSIIVEAFYKTSYMRFQCGTVAKPLQLKGVPLTDIDHGEVVFFRLKITEESTCTLLAEADNVLPRNIETAPEKQRCILPVRFTPLGERIWQLEFTPQPVLAVNVEIPGIGVDIKEIVKSDPSFSGLIYPQIIREVLTKILLVDQYDFDGEDSDWQSDWILFVRRINSEDLPEKTVDGEVDTERTEEWISGVVNSFCGRKHLATSFGQAHEEEK